MWPSSSTGTPPAPSSSCAPKPDGARAVAAFAEAVAGVGPLDRESFRAAATRAREKTGLKGRALFHPIRVALTAADSGPELDLAVPAIDRGAGAAAGQRRRPIRFVRRSRALRCAAAGSRATWRAASEQPRASTVRTRVARSTASTPSPKR